MAHLTRQQYDRRRENAAQRAIDNEAMAQQNGMTAEQAEIISDLCTMRHELHACNKKALYSDNTSECRELIRLNIKIKEAGLQPMSFVPVDEYDYMDIDCFDLLYETEDVPEDDDERDNWYDEHYEAIASQWEELNKNIEAYLAEIDNKYNTSYCPTGALRIF